MNAPVQARSCGSVGRCAVPHDAYLSVQGVARAPMLRPVYFDLDEGQILGIIGPSGAGKSTLARLIAGHEYADAGEVLLGGSADFPVADIQLILQQPAESLNPRFTAAEVVAEPLVIRRGGRTRDHLAEVHRWMEAVGLSPQADGKPAHEFSGGERQRLAIARAFAAEPKVLILDESFTGLDPAMQSQVAGLLRSRTAILISHDVAMVASLADRILVMEAGRIVEAGETAAILKEPLQPITKELLAASRALA